MRKCKTLPLKHTTAVSQSPVYYQNINTKSKLHPRLRQLIALVLYISLSVVVRAILLLAVITFLSVNFQAAATNTSYS